MEDKEKALIGLYKRLKNKTCENALLTYAEGLVTGQDALRAEYGVNPAELPGKSGGKAPEGRDAA